MTAKSYPRIKLTWTEQVFAAYSGAMRQISALAHDRPNWPSGKPQGDPWGTHIEGAGAEAAFAKFSRRYWHAVSRRPKELEGDVGGVQIRSTWRHNGRLIVHDDDKDEAPFVLVRGVFPIYEIVGWMLGKDAKKKEFWAQGDGRAAYFVPESKLNPMETLNDHEVQRQAAKGARRADPPLASGHPVQAMDYSGPESSPGHP